MSAATRQFAKVLGLFFVQGLLLWMATFIPHEQIAGPWLFALIGAVAAWWPLWFAFHRERTWQPWIETLLLMGASYWIPLFTDHFFRSLEPPPDAFIFIPPQAIFYLMLLYAVIFSIPVAAIWSVVRWLTTWHWQSAQASRVTLRGFFLLSAAAAIHLMSFLPMIQGWAKNGTIMLGPTDVWQNVFFSLALTLMLLSVSGIVLGTACLVAGAKLYRSGAILLILGMTALSVQTFWNQSISSEQLTNLCVGVAMIVLQAAITAFALRLFGYRLVSGRRAMMRKGAPLPPEIFIGKATTSEPTAGS